MNADCDQANDSERREHGKKVANKGWDGVYIKTPCVACLCTFVVVGMSKIELFFSVITDVEMMRDQPHSRKL